MSGEPTVAFAPTPTVKALLNALRAALQTPGLRAVLIGGMGVACRLAQVHRVTGDVDLVTDEDLEPATALLVRAGIGTADSSFEGRVYIDDTKLELIGTSALADPLEVEDEDDRLFVLAHRWALETGTVCHLLAEGSPQTTVAVATPAALIATKLHALRGRRREDRKRASDAYDIFRLLDLCDAGGDVSAALASGPRDLPRLVAAGVRMAFIDEADRTIHRMRTFGEPGWSVGSEDLRAVAEPMLEQLGD